MAHRPLIIILLIDVIPFVEIGVDRLNYQIRLIVGDAASFFLSEWQSGGVEITENVAGLFGAAGDSKGTRDDNMLSLYSELDVYGLASIDFTLTDMVKIGLSTKWTWTRIIWPRRDHGANASYLQEAENRLKDVLGPGLKDDHRRQVSLLKLIQAASRKIGEPIGIEGEVDGVGRRTEKIIVYKTGVVAYDRTPHPLRFLKLIAQVVNDRRSSV